ncbi:hypothetical protein WKH56_07300 [Priestia sp. SB1]|uniref:Uncharacterized protein n=1 Tax=Priestia aryabhattai TaxID=412384 RepID=A0AAX6NBV7_PRIAR|nr:hypothetical protein [Priestia aryabhattai]MDU9693216.1 hypothetical protein [Priestia aryabhattai]
MKLSVTETGYHSFNKLVINRLQSPLANEQHYFYHKDNYFSTKIDVASNDFVIKPAFHNSDSYFEEKWFINPHRAISTQQSCFSIKSKPLEDVNDFFDILKAYGFTNSGKLKIPYLEKDIARIFVDYLGSQLGKQTKYTIGVSYDKENSSIIIRDYFMNERSLRVIFLEDGYWFIPTTPSNDSFIKELPILIHQLLNTYELTSIFG